MVQSKLYWMWLVQHNRPGDQQSYCSWQACHACQGRALHALVSSQTVCRVQGTQGAVLINNSRMQTSLVCMHTACTPLDNHHSMTPGK